MLFLLVQLALRAKQILFKQTIDQYGVRPEIFFLATALYMIIHGRPTLFFCVDF